MIKPAPTTPAYFLPHPFLSCPKTSTFDPPKPHTPAYHCTAIHHTDTQPFPLSHPITPTQSTHSFLSYPTLHFHHYHLKSVLHPTPYSLPLFSPSYPSALTHWHITPPCTTVQPYYIPTQSPPNLFNYSHPPSPYSHQPPSHPLITHIMCLQFAHLQPQSPLPLPLTLGKVWWGAGPSQELHKGYLLFKVLDPSFWVYDGNITGL